MFYRLTRGVMQLKNLALSKLNPIFLNIARRRYLVPQFNVTLQ